MNEFTGVQDSIAAFYKFERDLAGGKVLSNTRFAMTPRLNTDCTQHATRVSELTGKGRDLQAICAPGPARPAPRTASSRPTTARCRA